MGRNNTQLRPLTHNLKHNDPDGLACVALEAGCAKMVHALRAWGLSGRYRILYMSYRAGHQKGKVGIKPEA